MKTTSYQIEQRVEFKTYFWSFLFKLALNSSVAKHGNLAHGKNSGRPGRTYQKLGNTRQNSTRLCNSSLTESCLTLQSLTEFLPSITV